jgi:tetratricopeptide (TPR) repeat protein
MLRSGNVARRDGASMGDNEIGRLSARARRAVELQKWDVVESVAATLVARDPGHPEGHFLRGLVENASRRPLRATEAFARALELDPERYDAAVELANQHSVGRRNAEAAALLARYTPKLSNSPRYLDMAGTTYTHIGLPEKAWPLYQQANALQPGVDLFQANMAACGVYLGKFEESKALYQALLRRFPAHQRNHWQLSRLERVKDTAHVEQMKELLRSLRLPPDKNVFLHYAIGKELEDLEQWDEAFEHYRMAGDAVAKVANYDVAEDIAVIDKLIEVCDERWLAEPPPGPPPAYDRTPIFVVGLPRTGTTLTERILSSHSRVESIGETMFAQMVLRRESGLQTVDAMNPAMAEALRDKDPRRIGQGYLDAVRYRLGDKPMFIDKLPFNFLYVGFLARAFPEGRFVHLRRNAMDACFAMYKQVFTFAYKFSYSLEALGRYYVAYERLREHWRRVLGPRFVEVEYEAMVADQEAQTRQLLSHLGLEFEPACLAFEENKAPSTTASSVQVREKIHSRSVQRWTHFTRQLQPLREYLEAAGIAIK